MNETNPRLSRDPLVLKLKQPSSLRSSIYCGCLRDIGPQYIYSRGKVPNSLASAAYPNLKTQSESALIYLRECLITYGRALDTIEFMQLNSIAAISGDSNPTVISLTPVQLEFDPLLTNGRLPVENLPNQPISNTILRSFFDKFNYQGRNCCRINILKLADRQIITLEEIIKEKDRLLKEIEAILGGSIDPLNLIASYIHEQSLQKGGS